MLNQSNVNGKYFIAKYKYGDKSILDTYEKCLELVKEYPIIYSVIPESFKDRNMMITFLEANQSWVRKYREMVKKEYEEDCELAKKNIFRAKDKGRFTNLKNNAIIDECVNFGQATKDPDFLAFAVENDLEDGFEYYSLGRFYLDENNYDEKCFKKAIEKQPAVVIRAYVYWLENISKYPYVIESVKNKNELYNNPEEYELAFFKCLDLIGDNEKALLYLYSMLSKELESSVNFDHVDNMKKIFSKLPVKMQNALVSQYYFCIKYMQKNAIDKELIKEIVDRCPIAGDILSNEDVLRYDLTQSETDELVTEKCKKCFKCQLRYIRFR